MGFLYDESTVLLDQLGFKLHSGTVNGNENHYVFYTETLIAILFYHEWYLTEWELNIDHRDAYTKDSLCPIRLTGDLYQQLTNDMGYDAFRSQIVDVCRNLGTDAGYEDSCHGRTDKYKLGVLSK